MAISTNSFKNGMTILYNDKMWTIVDFQHVKPGKGGAFVRTKLKEVKTGKVVDITFNAGAKVDEIRTETKHVQYLYKDGDMFYFMDTATYDQTEIGAEFVGEAGKWLRENDEVQIQLAGEEMIAVEPPMFVELEITETDPGFKGDTVQGGNKPATLETGAVIPVPMFLNTGDRVKVDTRDGSYVTRV